MLDHETAPSHALTFRVTDGDGLSAFGTVTVAVTNVNEPPAFGYASPPAISVNESESAGAAVIVVRATDPDQADTIIGSDQPVDVFEEELMSEAL